MSGIDFYSSYYMNESEYQDCKAWLAEANQETILHPVDNPELEMQRRRIQGLVIEYERNCRHSAEP